MLDVAVTICAWKRWGHHHWDRLGALWEIFGAHWDILTDLISDIIHSFCVGCIWSKPLYISDTQVIRDFVGCKLFFYLRKKKEFLFYVMNIRQFFLKFSLKNWNIYLCRMPFLLCTLPLGGFSGQHIFHQFRQQTFFSDHLLNKQFFFLNTRPSPHSPRYQMVRPSDGLVCQPDSFPFPVDRPAYSNWMWCRGNHVCQ